MSSVNQISQFPQGQLVEWDKRPQDRFNPFEDSIDKRVSAAVNKTTQINSKFNPSRKTALKDRISDSTENRIVKKARKKEPTHSKVFEWYGDPCTLMLRPTPRSLSYSSSNSSSSSSLSSSCSVIFISEDAEMLPDIFESAKSAFVMHPVISATNIVDLPNELIAKIINFLNIEFVTTVIHEAEWGNPGNYKVEANSDFFNFLIANKNLYRQIPYFILSWIQSCKGINLYQLKYLNFLLKPIKQVKNDKIQK